MKYSLTIVSLFFVLAGNAQTTPEITVHEWGTFTSKYTGYGKPYQDVHKTVDERVPDFVYHINFEKPYVFRVDYKDEYYYRKAKIEFMDASIKMETPVLYFYSRQAVTDLMVNVKFPQGSISEFYPLPVTKEDTNYVKSKINTFGMVVPQLYFKNYNGFAKWKINILSPDDLSKPSHPDETVPNVWLAPRKTAANMIESNGEKEKYIFYRGLGGFTNPIVPTYTKSGNMVITKNLAENISYVMVYEKTTEGKRYVWGINPINGYTSDAFIRNWTEVSDDKWNNVYRKGFVKALTNAGLYEDEAEAMLNTWDNSYFGKPGIKIFWIVPREFTEKILPISFSKQISSLERVMVGRTEIDPFNMAEIGQYIDDPPTTATTTEYTVFPNPSTSDIFIKFNKPEPETVKIEMIDFSGRVVNSCTMEVVPFTDCKIPFNNPVKGLYHLRVCGDKTSKSFNISMQ